MSDNTTNQSSDSSSVNELIHQQEFGVSFRPAREAAGYSITEVSELLKLSEDIIRALENSQVDKLPAATFTQGYIRSYARLLKLSASEIVAIYNQLHPEKEALKTSRKKIPAESSSADFGFKFFSYIVLIGGLILLALWWQQADVNWLDSSPIKSDYTEVQKTEEIKAIPTVDIIKSEVNNNTASDDVVIDKAPALPAVIKSERENNLENPDAIDDRADNVPLQEVLPAGDDILVVEAEADSWAEIEDANNNRFFFKLLKQGEMHTLQGQAPFRLFLGNGPSVNLKINNMPVDFSKYIKSNNIAYISIDDTAAVHAAKKIRKVISPDTVNEQTKMVDENILSDPVN
ncbi:MAG: DUF4115 domain-containing protein [Gammaproteobacteria bacterium]|nr:DUF4115 domain-containing protein [Gammaproteobacteria bacterium]